MDDILTYKGLTDYLFNRVAKYLYDTVNDYTGNDDDTNSTVDISIPFYADGWVEAQTGYTAEYFVNGINNTYINTNYMIHVSIDGDTIEPNFVDAYFPIWTDSRIGSVSIDGAYSAIRNSGTSGTQLNRAVTALDNAQLQAEYFALRRNDGFEQEKIYSRYVTYGVDYRTELFAFVNNRSVRDIFTRYNKYRNPPVDVTNLSKITILSTKSTLFMQQAHSSNPVDTQIGFDRSYNLIMISDDNTALNVKNNNSSDYNNTFNYTTNEGDTIKVYYGDNYISLGVGDGTVNNTLPLSYDDYKNIFNDIIGDLKVNVPDIDITPTYQFPSYTDIKYSDMGDFYISPIHQYGNLPTAPTFENTLDLSTYPSTIGTVASKFIDFLPASISALLTGVVIVGAIVSFIRRDS